MAAGVSEEALAWKLRVSGLNLTRSGLSKIETRLRRDKGAELPVLAEVLNRTMAELYPARPGDLNLALRQSLR